MKIGIDITPLLFSGSGVANYTYNFVKNLLLIDKKNQYKLFFVSTKNKSNYQFLKELETLGGKIIYYQIPFKVLEFLWQKNNLIPVDWLIGKTDVFYANDYLRSPSKTKTITTVHDLTWKIYPDYHTKDVIKAHQKKLEKTIKYKDTIIVDSYNTKTDLLKYYPQINKDNIYVIYPGVGDNFKPIKDKEKIKKVLKKYLTFNFSLLTFNFLLYVGAIEPRKNLDLSIKLFHQLINLKKYSHYKFLIVGKAGWKNEKIYQLTSQLGLENKVIFVGYVKDEDLPYFYNGAKLTLYLSSYEGFGLPPLESLSCGTPVLASDNSSMKETLPYRYLVNIKNEKEVFEKLINLLGKKIDVNYQDIKNKFQWKNFAKEFLKLITF